MYHEYIKKELDRLKLELHIIQVRKCGKICLMTKKVIFGLLGEYFIK